MSLRSRVFVLSKTADIVAALDAAAVTRHVCPVCRVPVGTPCRGNLKRPHLKRRVALTRLDIEECVWKKPTRPTRPTR